MHINFMDGYSVWMCVLFSLVNAQQISKYTYVHTPCLAVLMPTGMVYTASY